MKTSVLGPALIALVLGLSASVQAQEEELPQATGGSEGAAPARPGGAESGATSAEQAAGADAEPWYEPTPNFGGNIADQLRIRVDKGMQDSPEKTRVVCYLNKIRDAGSDDRVIWWTRICPTHGEDGSTEEVCGIGDVNEEDLHNAIKRPEDVDAAGKKLRIFTYVKSVAFHLQTHLGKAQDDKTVSEQMKRTDRDIQLAIQELGKIAAAPSDGTDSRRHYFAINAWIKQKQADSKSVYSCR